MTHAVKPPPPFISPKGMWASKLSLRFIQFVLAIALVGCAATISSSGVWEIAVLLIILPQAAVSAIWSLSEGICIVVRGGRRGIHPGANVALDLLIWLGMVGGTIGLWLLGIAALVVSGGYSSGYGYGSGYSSSSYSSYSNYVSGADLAKTAGMGQALVGLGATLAILHFVTFVIACVETNKRNRLRHTTQVVYVNGGPQYPPQNQPPQYPPQNQPPMYPPVAGPEQAYQYGGMKA